MTPALGHGPRSLVPLEHQWLTWRSVVARSNSILKQLVLQAKREYEADAVHRIQIYFADSHGSWRWTDSRHKRPMSSIVLQPGVKEMLLADARDFLRSEKVSGSTGLSWLLNTTSGMLIAEFHSAAVFCCLGCREAARQA